MQMKRKEREKGSIDANGGYRCGIVEREETREAGERKVESQRETGRGICNRYVYV